MESSTILWRELLETAARRKLMILLGVVLGVGMGFYAAFSAMPVYRAKSTLLFEAQRGRLTISPSNDSAVRFEHVSPQELNKQMAFLRSPALLKEVLIRSGVPAETMESRPAERPSWTSMVLSPRQGLRELYQRYHGIAPASALEQMVEMAQLSIAIEPVRGTNLVEFSYVHRSPEAAAEFVNLLLDAHVERQTGLGQEQALRFLGNQRELLGDKLQKAEDALEAFRLRHGIEALPSDESQLEISTSTLLASRAAAEREISEVTARIDFLRSELAKRPAQIEASRIVGENSSAQMLNARLVELRLERTELLSRYAPTSTLVKDLDRQIAGVEELLAGQAETIQESERAINPAFQSLEVELLQAEAQLVTLRARASALASDLAQQQAIVQRVGRLAPELRQLEQEVQLAATAYENYLRKEEEARFSSALDESGIVNFTVVEPAVAPRNPEPSSRARTLVTFAGIGLFLGLVAGFVRDWIDPSVKGAAQAQRCSGLPVISEIPAG